MTTNAFRRLVPNLGPRWFVKDELALNGQKYETDSRLLYTMMLMLDWSATRLRRGLLSSMPRPEAADDALALFGQARDVLRGPSESRASYLERLRTSIDDKRVAGNAWALLSQIRGYCSPHAVRVRIINTHGNAYTIERDGSQSTYRHGAWNWDNAIPLAKLTGNRIPWSTFWVVVYPTTDTPSQPWQRDGTWGDGETWGPSSTSTWGSTATPDDVFAIRRIVRRWKPAGSRCVSIIISFDDTAFDPASSAPPLPDGTWKYSSKYSAATPGRRVPARDAGAIYWQGTRDGAPL